MKKLIGICQIDDISDIIKKAENLYNMGYNSLFIQNNNSFHDYVSYIYCAKKTKGRTVNNPKKWIRNTVQNEIKKACGLFRLSRRYYG